jgi:endonuclease/exonuclease/phosphatase family metal-dependent hydrolase
MPAWIRGLVWLSGRDIQRETIQHMKDADYVDGFRRLHAIEKGYTFPVWDPHLRLDYVFVPSKFADRLTDCEVIAASVLTRKASDHFPLLAHLHFTQTLPEKP